MTTGKTPFSIPIWWMRKEKLRSLESKCKSLLDNELAASRHRSKCRVRRGAGFFNQCF